MQINIKSLLSSTAEKLGLKKKDCANCDQAVLDDTGELMECLDRYGKVNCFATKDDLFSVEAIKEAEKSNLRITPVVVEADFTDIPDMSVGELLDKSEECLHKEADFGRTDMALPDFEETNKLTELDKLWE